MFKLTLVSLFSATVLAQSLDSECYSVCEEVQSLSDSCSESSGYQFDGDIVLAQGYLNCMCATSNSALINEYSLLLGTWSNPISIVARNVRRTPTKTWGGSSMLKKSAPQAPPTWPRSLASTAPHSAEWLRDLPICLLRRRRPRRLEPGPAITCPTLR